MIEALASLPCLPAPGNPGSDDEGVDPPAQKGIALAKLVKVAGIATVARSPMGQSINPVG